MIPEETIEQRKDDEEKNNVDRRKISEESLKSLAADIDEIDDPETKSAVKDLAHIVTGDDRFE